MNYQKILIVILQIVYVHPVPLQLPLLQMQQQFPVRAIEQPQQAILQQQLLAVQQLEVLQKLKAVLGAPALYSPQPIIILLTNTQETGLSNMGQPFKSKDVDPNEDNSVKENTENMEYVDEDLDSIVIKAEPNVIETNPTRATSILLIPSGKFIIGDFISGISWLPIEVNVPDTLSWAYNGIASGIAGIISIIGQRLPFRPTQQMDVTAVPQASSLKELLRLQMKPVKSVTPIIVMPL